MKIAVIGAGAIGGLIAGYLKFKGENVFLVGKNDSILPIKNKGLFISGSRGNIKVDIDVADDLIDTPDLAILTVKTQDCEKAVKDYLKSLKNTVVLTTQNGVQADVIVAKYIAPENIISSIIMFGVTYLEPGKIVHNFEGAWVIGRLSGKPDVKLNVVRQTLLKAFPIYISEDISGMKYLKIFVNANNCIPAILGVSMQEAFSDPEISKISIMIWKEALEIITRSGIKLVSLPDFSVERVNKLTALPINEAAKIFSEIMSNLSSEPLYGSILQSIKRNRPSEITYINGEFVSLAKKNKLSANLNEKLVALVIRVEISRKFLTKEQLLSEVKEFMH